MMSDRPVDWYLDDEPERCIDCGCPLGAYEEHAAGCDEAPAPADAEVAS